MLKSLKHTNWANTRGSNGPKEDSNSLAECFFLWMISNIRIAIGSYINVQILEMILIIIGLVWDKIKSETIRAPTQKSDMNREVHLTFNGPGKQKCVQYRFKRSPGICCCCLSSKSNVKRRVTSKYTKF